jgi:hypothetical protein
MSFSPIVAMLKNYGMGEERRGKGKSRVTVPLEKARGLPFSLLPSPLSLLKFPLSLPGFE